MTTYDIELVQNDTDNVGAVLKENGTGANLTNTTVTFSMINDAGTEHEITCTPGATISGVSVGQSAGGITVPFTATHTATSGLFQGKFTVTLGEYQQTFPSGDDYISVRIWEAV